MSRERVLTLHAGFYPQLARGLTSKFSFTRSVSRGAGKHYKTLGSAFAQHVQEMSNSMGGNNLLSALSSSNTVATKMAGLAPGLQSRLNAAKLYLATEMDLGSKDPYRQERPTSWKDIVGDVDTYNDLPKKFALRGNYVWYTARTSGPKDIAKAYLSKRQNQFRLEDAEDWYQTAVGATESNQLRKWALRTLGMGGPNEHLDEATIQKMHDDAAEEVATGGEEGIEKAPSPKGTARGRDFILDGKAIESTEQSGISHGLVGDFPIKGAKSGATEKEKKKLAKAWEGYMRDPVIKTWNTVTEKLMKKRSTKLGKVIEKSGKELRKEIKDLANKKAGGTKANKKGRKKLARLKMAAGMDDAFFRNIKHNIANEGQSKYKGWVEGVPISDRDETTGKRLYASTEIDSRLKNTYIKYSVKAGGVTILDAISHAHGLMENSGKKQLANHYLNQQMNYAHGAANNTEGMTHTNGVTTSGITATGASLNHKMNTSASKKMGEMFFQILEKKILKGLRESIVKDQSGIKAGLKTFAKSDSHNLFWASPYVGLEEGLYISRK